MNMKLMLSIILSLGFLTLHAQNCPGYANTASGSGEACGNQIYTMTVENTDCNGEIYITIETNFANGYGFSWDLESVSTGNTVGSGSNGSTTVTIGPIDPNTEGNSFDLIVNDPNGVGFLASEFVEASQGGNILATVDNPGHQMFASNITISDATITIQTPSGGPITETVGNCKNFIVQVPLTNDDYCTTKNINLPWEITCDETGATLSSGNHSVTVGPQVPNDPSDLVDITWNTATCSWDVSTNFDCDNADIGDIFDISPDPSTSPSDVCIDSDETFTVSYNGISGGPNCCATAGPLTDITYNETIDPGDVTPSTSPFWTNSDHAGYIHFPPNGTGGNATSIDLCVDVNNFCFQNPNNDQYYYVFIYVDGINVVQEPYPNGGNASICLDLTDVPTYDQSSNVEIYVLPNAFNVDYGVFFPDLVNTTFQPSKSCGSLGDAEWNADIEATIDVTFEEQIGTPVACSEDVTAPYTNCQPPQPTTAINTAADCDNPSTVTVTNYDNTLTYNISPSGASIDGTGVISGSDGSYTLTVSNGNCDVDKSFTIDPQLPVPTFTVTGTNPTMCGATDGSITISGLDPNTNYNISYNGGPTSAAISDGSGEIEITGLGAGNYTDFTVENGGCVGTNSASVGLSAPSGPDAPTFTIVAPTCTTAGTATISNYDNNSSYTITPSGPTINSSGDINGANFGQNYSVEVDLGGCTSSASFQIEDQMPTPNIPTFTVTDPTCSADGFAQIDNYDNALTYSSSPSGVSIDASGEITGADGTYTITVANSDGCNNDDDVTIKEQLDNPTISVSTTDPTVCGDDGEIVFTFSNVDDGTYDIGTFNDVSVSGGTATINAPAGTYSNLEITNQDGCLSNSESVTLNDPDAPDDPVINTTDPTCTNAGSSTVTNYDASNTYNFTPSGPTIGSGGAITGTTPGESYEITAVDGACSSASITFTDEPHLEHPTFTTTTTNPTCGNNNGEIVITPDPGFTITDYSIDNGASTHSGGTFSNLGDGIFDIVITDNNGCVGTGKDTLIESGSNEDASFNLTNFCKGTKNSATITGTPDGTFSIVSPTSDGATVNSSTGEITNGEAGTTYTLAYATPGACPDTTTEQVTVLLSPEADFTATPESGTPPLTVEFENTSLNADSSIWNFGIGEDLYDDNIILPFTYENKGDYMVTLVTKTDEGCQDTATFIISINALPMIYSFPNVFTPNGDGQNDMFKLINAMGIEDLDIVILNRWGNPVFESDEVNFNWNGKVKNSGADCSEGTYFYKANLKGVDGTEKVEQGFVQLSRNK